MLLQGKLPEGGEKRGGEVLFGDHSYGITQDDIGGNGHGGNW